MIGTVPLVLGARRQVVVGRYGGAGHVIHTIKGKISMSDFSHRTVGFPTAAGASADIVHVRAHVPPPSGTLA